MANFRSGLVHDCLAALNHLRAPTLAIIQFIRMRVAEMLKAIQRLSEERCLQQGNYIDEVLTSQKPKDQTRNSPNVLKHQLEKSLLSPPTPLRTVWLDKLQQYIPYLPPTDTQLILGTGDGIFTLILLTFTNCRRPRPGRRFVSLEMVWTAKFRDTKNSLSLQIPTPPKTRPPSNESLLIRRIVYVELLAASPLYRLDSMVCQKLYYQMRGCST